MIKSSGAEIRVSYLSFGKGVEGGLLDAGSVLGETHVLQHHDTAQKKSSGVGKTLASNVGGGTVDSLEDRALVTDVTGGCQTETTDQTGAHVRQDVTVQVGHNQNLVVVGNRVGDDLQARVVQQLSVEFDIGELLGDIAGKVQEKTVGHLHDGSLVHHADLLLVDGTSVLEGEAQHALGGLLGDKLDALHNAIDDDVLDTRVFTLGVLTDQDGVDVVVRGLVASDGSAGTNVGEQVEGTAESKVQRNVSLADGGLYERKRERIQQRRSPLGKTGEAYSKGTLERNEVLLHALDGIVGDGGLAILQDGSHINGLPLDGGLYGFLAFRVHIVTSFVRRGRDGVEAYVCGSEDVLDGLRDLGANAVTLNQSHGVFSLTRRSYCQKPYSSPSSNVVGGADRNWL